MESQKPTRPFHQVIKDVCFQSYSTRKDARIFKEDLDNLIKLMDELALCPEFNMNKFGTTEVSIIPADEEKEK